MELSFHMFILHMIFPILVADGWRWHIFISFDLFEIFFIKIIMFIVHFIMPRRTMIWLTREKVTRIKLLFSWHWSWGNKIAGIKLIFSKQRFMGRIKFLLPWHCPFMFMLQFFFWIKLIIS